MDGPAAYLCALCRIETSWQRSLRCSPRLGALKLRALRQFPHDSIPREVEPPQNLAMVHGALVAASRCWQGGDGLRRLARGRSGRFGRISARASTVLARVVVGFAAAASVASRQSDVVDVSSCRARRQSYTALRHNGAVKLSGLLGSLVEAGRGSYSTVDGPEHGRARSLPHGR